MVAIVVKVAVSASDDGCGSSWKTFKRPHVLRRWRVLNIIIVSDDWVVSEDDCEEKDSREDRNVEAKKDFWYRDKFECGRDNARRPSLSRIGRQRISNY